MARCSRVKRSAVMVWATGRRQPAPTPWTPGTGPASVIEVAIPENAEPTRKIAMPTRKIFLRPYMSARRPHSGIVAISASR